MAKTITLSMVSDADWIDIRTGLSEEEFEQFLEGLEEFDDDRVYFIEYGCFRSMTANEEGGDSEDLDEEIYDNSFNPYDEDSYYDEDNDSDDPVRKKLCEELTNVINHRYGSIKELAPNSVTILEKWHIYKETDDFELELEDDEVFDEEKLQFVIDDYTPDWLSECRKRTGECLEDIFVEDRIAGGMIVYKDKLLYASDGEDLGADLVVRFAIRTDNNGNVVSVEELDIDDDFFGF